MQHTTHTGGRDATTAIVPGSTALSIGKPTLAVPSGFTWTRLSSVARLESGHTPSRAHKEYWNGPVPWLSIPDAAANHGKTLLDTKQHISQAGVENSSTRLLPRNTVCLSRTASVGYVVIMGVPMCTSQDFINWICGPELDPRYLKYVLMLESETIRDIFAFGSTHRTLYYPDAKALYIAMPPIDEQHAIADVLGALDDKIANNEDLSHSAESLMVALVSELPLTARLHQLASQSTDTVRTDEMKMNWVAHFSIPAYDADTLPVQEPGSSIKSSKFRVSNPSVLISKLNPRFPRIWNVPNPEAHSVASTEFIVLEPRSLPTSALWAVLATRGVSDYLAERVSGTSGSHQRVRPRDLMDTPVPDRTAFGEDLVRSLKYLGRTAAGARRESRTLTELRDTLLPALMDGRIRVKDAVRTAEEAL